MSFSHIDESKETVLEKVHHKEHVVSDVSNNGQIKHKYGSNCPKKKDVIDEGIERIQEKLKKMKNEMFGKRHATLKDDEDAAKDDEERPKVVIDKPEYLHPLRSAPKAVMNI